MAGAVFIFWAAIPGLKALEIEDRSCQQPLYHVQTFCFVHLYINNDA